MPRFDCNSVRQLSSFLYTNPSITVILSDLNQKLKCILYLLFFLRTYRSSVLNPLTPKIITNNTIFYMIFLLLLDKPLLISPFIDMSHLNHTSELLFHPQYICLCTSTSSSTKGRLTYRSRFHVPLIYSTHQVTY